MQHCESAEQPSKMHSGILVLKDLLIVGGMVYEGTVILGHGTLGTKVETLATELKDFKKEFTDFKTETNTKLDKVLNQRWFLWR